MQARPAECESLGVYVTINDTSVQSASVQEWDLSLSLSPLTITADYDGLGDSIPTCKCPDITNVATKQSNGIVTVTWDFSHLDGLPYCPGTRQFAVAVRSYKTYEAAKADVSFLNGEFDYDDAGRRTTEYNVTGIDFNKFHRFYVKSRFVTGSGSTSKLQHFGEVGEYMYNIIGDYVG